MIALLAPTLATIACQFGGTGQLTTPDPVCTPGARTVLTRQQVCTPKDRPSIPRSLRASIAEDYGVPGFVGELDHRIPLFLGGSSTRPNLWPEVGPIPNLKDRLEFYAYDRICRDRTLRVSTAVRWFRGDWRTYYRRYQP